jgi:hypothetical protein
VVVAQLPGVAQSAPLPNLVLACSDESAIGRDFGSCHNPAYQIPTSQLVVFSGSSLLWSTASDLAGSDLVLVCTIPVEPDAYSSCRDAAGIRRTAFVPKDSVISGGSNSVIVSKTGGDYSDPVTAAENAFAGDTWCVAPQWPLKPCVMAIGEGTFVLGKTFSIAEGLAVSGNGKGDTMLVADNGVETAVSSTGNVRISDLTVINSQSGLARTTGIDIRRPGRFGPVLQLENVGIHVAGAARNVAVVRSGSVEILDSEITAVGQDTAGIYAIPPADYFTVVTLERSYISAEVATDDQQTLPGVRMQLIDSHIFGTVSLDSENSRLEIVRSGIVGNVSANNDNAHIVITSSSIKGHVSASGMAAHTLEITDTSVEGGIGFDHGGATIDGLTLQGEIGIGTAGRARILRSYINSQSTAAALSVLQDADVQLEQTFLQGALALAADARSELGATLSVLAGPVSGSAGAVLSCTDTFGADYELLSASCQPQVP